MTIFRRVTVVTEPTSAEVTVNGERVGFSPCEFVLTSGKNAISISKIGFLTYKEMILVSDNSDNSDRNIDLTLEKGFPILIESDRSDLQIVVKRGDTVVSEGMVTPAKLTLPYGKYNIELLNYGNKRRFKGKVEFSPGSDTIKLPCYSYGTFSVLVADVYYFAKPQLKIEGDSYYTHLGNIHFGRFNLLPGLATSIGRYSAFLLNKDKKGTVVDIETENTRKRKPWMGNLSVLTNCEFRAGGAILHNLDVSAVGSFAYYPSWKWLFKEKTAFNHLQGTEFFIGVEFTTHLSYANVNIKIGQEFWGNGKLKYYEGSTKVKEEKFKLSTFSFTVGISLGQAIYSSNNMLRIWQKPWTAKY
jgi:hypothetical protein